MAEKRPADSEPSEETLAICTNCSNISNNLKTCEHCGNALSESSTSRCYSAEPLTKRARTSTDQRTDQTISTSAEGQKNGEEGGGDRPSNPPSTAAAAVSSTTVSTASGSKSKDTAASGSRSNTPASERTVSPAPSGSRTSSPVDKSANSTTSTKTTTSTSTKTMNGAPVPQMLYMNNTNARGPAPATGAPIPAGPPIPAGAVPMNMYVNVNNQAVPIPAQPGSNASSNTAASRTGSTTNTSPAPARPASNTAAPQSYSNSSSSEQTASNLNKFSLVIDVHQIRVGVRKFLPMPNSSVLFKDDGVLFTLKEYPNAPLLLNARAIQQCKANLTSQMPALFFYLEGSCIKQIRNIFKMSQQEFSEKANDRVSTIALFPTQMDSNRASGIRTAFEIMQRKFNRPQNLLKEVSADNIVDFMYGYPTNTEIANPSASRVNQPASGPPPLQSIQQNNRAAGIAVNSLHGQPATMPAASQMLRTVAQQSLVPGMTTHQMTSQMHPMMAQRQARPAHQAARNQSLSTRAAVPNIPGSLMNPRTGMNHTPPLLTIPEDHEQWNNVKKKLVPGGVYQVQMRDGQRKYCLWNGTTLVPCLVQDQEVQLKCDYIRIGSLRCKSNDTVRIRNDGANSGIYFKFQNPQTRITEEIIITQEELVDCLVCFDRMCAMFIYPTANCATKIRTKCRMTSMSKDPTYNPFSKVQLDIYLLKLTMNKTHLSNDSEERRRHLILFLKDVNADQRESLLKMKRTGLGDSQQRQMVRQIDALQSLQILSTIKQNTALSQSKIQDYFGKGAQNQDLESLARELQNPDLTDGAAAEPTPIDDDDDDVIMTQEEIGVKCPYTQSVMKDPIKNKICGHNYEKVAILEFIARRKAKGNARCPYAGCGNQKPLTTDDLTENHELRQYIQKQLAEGTLNT